LIPHAAGAIDRAIVVDLRGVAQTLQPTQALWYERQFNLPAPGNGAHVLLHFEAVDYITTVIVNGKTVGEHQVVTILLPSTLPGH
jgi:beta-galactosidase/beta-glucuronidase